MSRALLVLLSVLTACADQQARRSMVSSAARDSVDSLPRGAQLRIHSDDTAAVNVIHQFLAFQRQDHRAGGSGAAH